MEDLNIRYYIPYRVCPNIKPEGNGIKSYICLPYNGEYWPYNLESVKAYARKYAKEKNCEVKIVTYIPKEEIIIINQKEEERKESI